jgi:hypothetical protein
MNHLPCRGLLEQTSLSEYSSTLGQRAEGRGQALASSLDPESEFKYLQSVILQGYCLTVPLTMYSVGDKRMIYTGELYVMQIMPIKC